MNYKNLLESGEPVHYENDRFKHFKNPVTSERYFSNYLSYKIMPTTVQLEQDLAYLGQEQKGYASDFAFLFFAENQDFSVEMKKYLDSQGFECSKHLIFTNLVENLQLKARDLGDIRIVQLDESHLNAYLQVEYQAHLQYGQTYADQMLADGRATALTNGSKVYLALDGEKIIGSLTAWFFEGYVEVDDYHVDSAYQGRGIGSALQMAALENQEKVILIAEEENRDMYQHQGYKEVAWYWTALRSDSRMKVQSE